MDFSKAVEKTLAYGSFFNFPLSPSEVHYWLISSHPVSKEALKKYLPTLKPKEILLRKNLLNNTKTKERIVLKFIKLASFIPGIRLIGLTGSVAAYNSRKNDDLDLIIITAAHTLWLVRPLLLLLLSIKFNRRHPGDNPSQINNAFCPNLWLDTLSLSVPNNRQNIYTAHEVLLVRPMLDRGQTFKLFIQSNAWTKQYLANAYQELSSGKLKIKKPSRVDFLVAPINFLSFILQYLYMLPKITSEKVSLHAAFFHKSDLSEILEKHLNIKPL